MGAVTYDIHKGEREFQSLTLSDEDVVKYLIQHRSKLDSMYSSTLNFKIDSAGDTFEFNQELIALYISLDNVIERCKFKEKQAKLLELLFDGHEVSEIIKMDIGYGKSATYDLLDRMVLKIVKVHNKTWSNSMRKKGYINK